MSLKSTAWKWLIVGHRWLGIVTCLFFAMWFVTGVVMIYVAFPEYTRAERLDRLAPIDWDQVEIAPERILHGRALGEFPTDFRLEMMLDEPVYRVRATGWPRMTVSARTGQRIEQVDVKQAREIAERAANASASFVETLERDQWTVAQSFDPHRPLHRVALDNSAGLDLYVSSRTGEIVLDTTKRERAWNWLGSVLHWLYFTELRARPALWSDVVKWISGIGIVVAVTGLWLGIDRLRIRRRTAASITPFRGWMAWHHIVGTFGGVCVLTWIFSGWMSMGPSVPWDGTFDPSRREQVIAALAGNTEPNFPTDLENLHALEVSDAREASFMWTLGTPQIVITDRSEHRTVIQASDRAPRTVDAAGLAARIAQALPGETLIATERLDQPDSYWYERRGDPLLPVLRFKLNDPERTWIHVDPLTGRLLGWLQRGDRTNRWLFNGLHSLDFRWLLSHRPTWDIVMWLLSLVGLTISVTSVVIGWRALKR